MAKCLTTAAVPVSGCEYRSTVAGLVLLVRDVKSWCRGGTLKSLVVRAVFFKLREFLIIKKLLRNTEQ